MKKYLKYIAIILIVVIGYKVGDKVLDKMYFSKYDIVDYMGEDRFETNNTVIEKRFKKADTAVLVNTNYIDQMSSVSVYAYDNNYPVFYTERERVMKPVFKELKKLGVKKVIIIGGTNMISESSQRRLEVNGYKVERIISSRGTGISLKLAQMIADKNPIDSIAIVNRSEFDLPNGISFSAYAQANNIPIIVTTNEEDDMLRIQEFVKKNKIKKAYIISNDDYLSKNMYRVLPDVVEIFGKDRFEVNTNIIDNLYNNKENKKIFISKGGELKHKRHIAPGQLVNAIALSPLAADNKAPLMYVKENYFDTRESKIISDKGYKEINEVGFKIERRNFFNVERFKVPTTIILILLSWTIAFRLFRTDTSN